MSSIDIALAIIVLIGAYGGYRDGFLMTLFSLLAIILGVLGGFKLMGKAMFFLADKFNIDATVLPYISFFVVFILIVIIVTLVGRLIRSSIDGNFLGQVDQILGSLLGVIKIIFMTSVLLWILDSMKVDLPERWTENSWLYPKVALFAPKLTAYIGRFVPVFKGIF